MKKKVKKTYSEDQVAVILEDINSKLNVLVEGHQNLDEKIDRGFAQAKEDLDEFKLETRDNFKTVFNFIDETKSNFSAAFDYLSGIDEKLKDIKLEIKDLKEILKNNKAGLERLNSLERKVNIMEKVLIKQKMLKA